MTRHGIAAALLGAVLVALGGVLVFEAQGFESTALPAVAVRGAVPANGSAAPEEAASDPAAAAGVALGRPLFSSSRRPPGGAVAAVAGLPRLTGVLVSDAGRRAVFAGSGGGRAVVVPEGGAVGAYTVRSIAPGQVTVDGPSGARVLRPSFGKEEAVAEAPPPVPARSVEDLMRNPPSYPPTPGLPAILGAQPPALAPGEAAAALNQLLSSPPAGIAPPGLPPSPAPLGPAQ